MQETQKKIVIIGTGPAGLGAAIQARELGLEFELYEKQSRPLGRCKSHEISGIFFDEGPHISFTKSDRVRELFLKNIKGQLNYLKPVMLNYWRGDWIPHPIQSHLGYLPAKTKEKILKEIEQIYSQGPQAIDSFEEWLRQHFGKEFFDLFSAPYTRKYWTLEPHLMTADWVGGRIFRPSIEDLKRGAESRGVQQDAHYFTEFRYPKSGGYEAFLKPTADEFRSQTHFQSSVTAINPKSKWIEINGSRRVYYDVLINSIPMDLMPDLVVDGPNGLKDSAKQLSCSSVTLYNILFRASKSPSSHWGYVYDENIPFARFIFPQTMTGRENDIVQGVQAEVYSSKYRPRNADFDSAENVLNCFEKMGIFQMRDVIDIHTQSISHANVIFDHQREKARDHINSFLTEHQIYGVGRYGSWRYLWSDESFLDGIATLKRVLGRNQNQENL